MSQCLTLLDISSMDYSFSPLDNARLADYLGIDAMMVSPCASTPILCFSGFADSGDDTNLVLAIDASWCICGFRIAFDGSLLGLCSVCAREISYFTSY